MTSVFCQVLSQIHVLFGMTSNADMYRYRYIIDMGMFDMWYIWLWQDKLLVIVKRWAPSEIDFDLWCVCHVLSDPRWLEGWTHCQVCISLCLCWVRRNWDTQLFQSDSFPTFLMLVGPFQWWTICHEYSHRLRHVEHLELITHRFFRAVLDTS